jgi:hypothetical protein
MEAVYSSETLVCSFKSLLRYNPYNQHRHLHRRENLKFDTADWKFIEYMWRGSKAPYVLGVGAEFHASVVGPYSSYELVGETTV